MRKWYPVVLIVAAVTISIVAYPRMPDRVPIHWTWRGEIDAYGPKLTNTILLPAALLTLWALLRFLPRIDPLRENYAKFQETYDLVVNCALTVIALVHVAVVAATLGWPVSVTRLLTAGLGLTLVVIGNVLPRARRNWWFGIRTPWTLSNERVWERTQRVAGYLLFGVGVVGMVVAFIPVSGAEQTIPILAVGAGVVSVVYSYYAWRQESPR
jgi:uncharacterized membrane protein